MTSCRPVLDEHFERMGEKLYTQWLNDKDAEKQDISLKEYVEKHASADLLEYLNAMSKE